MKPVRRILSIVLLLVFALAGAAPLLASTAGAESQVPLCCRQGGAHHCSGMGVADPSGPQLRMTCPEVLRLVSPLPNQAAWNGVRPLLRAPDVVSPRAAARTADDPRGQWIAARDSRGPPQA